jgi:hypothetical protein
VSRFGLRLVAMASLAAYLLANTNASLAVQFIPRPARTTVQNPSPPAEEVPANPKKCKHCSKPAESNETPAEGHKSSSPQSSNKDDCTEPSCPCCPADPDHKNCPCPGGCAICSVAKVPLLPPLNLDFEQAICLGNCLGIDSFQYISPICDGLDRPPRI